MHVEVEAYDKNSAEDKMIDEYLTNSHSAYGDIEVKFVDEKEVTSAWSSSWLGYVFYYSLFSSTHWS